jgi:hypothetical protein
MRIELSELGDGFWIEVKDPKRLPWGKQKQIASVVKENDVATGLDATELLTIALVKSGYVLDENDKPIDFPLTTENIVDVPSLVVEKVSEIYAESKKEVKSKN